MLVILLGVAGIGVAAAALYRATDTSEFDVTAEGPGGQEEPEADDEPGLGDPGSPGDPSAPEPTPVAPSVVVSLDGNRALEVGSRHEYRVQIAASDALAWAPSLELVAAGGIVVVDVRTPGCSVSPTGVACGFPDLGVGEIVQAIVVVEAVLEGEARLVAECSTANASGPADAVLDLTVIAPSGDTPDPSRQPGPTGEIDESR